MGLFKRLKPGQVRNALPMEPPSFDPYTQSEVEDAERVNQALALIQQRDTQSALRLLHEVAARTPDNYVNEFERDGKLYIKFWDKQEFISYVDSIQSHPRAVIWVSNAYPRAFHYLGYLNVELGNFEAALQFLDQGLRLDPENPKLNCEKAQTLIRLKRQAEALQIYARVLARNGYLSPHDRAAALRGKGFVLMELDDLDGAERAFLQSQEYDPDSPNASHELRYIQQLRNRAEGAARLGIPQDKFNILYQSYSWALSSSARKADWNEEIDDLARSVGALSEPEIVAARTDFHQAVLNRIALRVVMDRRSL